VFSLLEALDGSSLTGWGTNLESLLDAARDSFQSSFPSRRLILLISDGESLSGSPRAALDRCAGDGIRVSALALGSDEGRPVPQGEGGEPSLAGPVLLSRRDSALMHMTAERSGGLYIDGNREDAARVLAAHLRSLAPESGSGGGPEEKKQRWSLFVIAALLAYAASKLSLLKFRGGKILFSLLILFVFVSCSRISGRLLIVEANFLHSQGRYNEALASYLKALDYEDAAPYAEYGLGSVYYSLDEGKAALERFAASREMLESLPAASHRELLYRNYYNSGLALFGEGDFSGAAAAFREALKTDPVRLEAKRNLELSLLSLTAENRARQDMEQESEESRARDVLFDYLRQKEQSRWQSREWPAEEKNTGPDY
jgi:Ca-activated chloride channel family protein